MRRSSYTLLYIAVSVTLLFSACKQKTVYNRYLHTSVTGWERNDTLFYAIPSMKEGGNYTEEVGVRINGEYPFLSLTLIIEQTRVSDQVMKRDTLQCDLIDKQGHYKGKGISHYQNTFHLKTIRLNKDDSLRIAIRHDMKREMLPGITEIGVKLSKR